MVSSDRHPDEHARTSTFDKNGPQDRMITVQVNAAALDLAPLRVVAADFAARANFDLDAVADLRLAVDEAASQLVAVSAPGSVLTCVLSLDAAQMGVTASVPSHSGTTLRQDSFGWRVLTTLVDEVRVTGEAEANPPVVGITLLKRRPGLPIHGDPVQELLKSPGQLAVLNEAIVVHRKTLASISSGHPDRSKILEEAVSRLEAWRLETLAAATLGLPSDTAGGVQVLPVRYYIDTDDRSVAVEVEGALELLLESYGFRVEMPYRVETGSFFRKVFYSSRERLTPEEVAASLAKIERAAGVRALDLPQSQVDANRADGVAKLLAALERSPSAVIQIGSILLVKVEGTPVVMNLTPQELAELERAPSLFRTPHEVLDFIHKLRQGGQGWSELPTVGT